MDGENYHGGHFAVGDFVVGGDCTAEEGRSGVTGGEVCFQEGRAVVGVAIDAAVGAGIVCADIHAGRAAAGFTLVGVFH